VCVLGEFLPPTPRVEDVLRRWDAVFFSLASTFRLDRFKIIIIIYVCNLLPPGACYIIFEDHQNKTSDFHLTHKELRTVLMVVATSR